MTPKEWLRLLDGLTRRMKGHRRQICKVASLFSAYTLSILVICGIISGDTGTALMAATVTLFTGLDQVFTPSQPVTEKENPK